MEHLTQETPRQTIERCAKAGADWLGDKVEFRVADVDMERAQARAIFERHGLGDYVVEDPRPETVLKDSARRGHSPDGYLTRPFVSPNPDTPLAIHVTRVRGTDESGDKYECLARIRLGHRRDPNTGESVPVAIARPPEGQATYTDGRARERALWIANAANHRLNHVLAADVSAAMRKALEGLGCAKSLGGGNNYWVPTAVSERAHGFLDDVARELGAYYLRTPVTTTGAPHERVAFQQAATVSLEDDLQAMEEELEKAVQAAKNPTVTKTGKIRKRTATLTHKVELCRSIKAKLELYDNVLQSRIQGKLDGLRAKLERSFETLLDGGSVTWEPEAPPSSDEEPAPETSRSAEPAGVAAAGREDPFGWA